MFGCVEQTIWSRDHVVLRGWSMTPALRVSLEDHTGVSLSAVAAEPGACGDTRTSFEVRLDRRNAGAAVLLTPDHCTAAPTFRIAPPSRFRGGLACVLALPGALRHAFGHRSDILRFLRTGDPGLSSALRDAFGFGDDPDKAPLVPREVFMAPQSGMPAPERPVVVIVPVHDAPCHVHRLLGRLEAETDVDHRILLIDDGSEDPSIQPMLTSFASRHPARVRLVTLAENFGFVAAVNHGLHLARAIGEHVILLNTDTLPPDGWIGRLIGPILSDPDVASVTPLSNAAEIASIPSRGAETALCEALVQSLDSVAAGLGTEWRGVGIPTGIGFAMAMNRRFLDHLGGFDPAFGRGYGEEVDWCQRARALGGKHVLATSVFIGHQGGASFGSAEKKARLESSAQIIRKRYPGYERAVHDWARTAPHAVPRAVLTIPWLDAMSDAPVPVFLGHVLGGGAELALQREMQALLRQGAPGAVILRTGGAARWRADIEGAGFRQSCRFSETDTLLRFLDPLRRRRIVYSCGAGARDPRDIPEILLRLIGREGSSLELRLHDYFPVSPSYCLLDSQGRYRGVPDLADQDCAHNLSTLGDRPALPLRDWRGLWTEVTERASLITAFSASSAEVFATAYPHSARKIAVEPHAPLEAMPGALAPGGGTIGVLGGINRAKGAEVLIALARQLRARNAPRKIVVIGGLDPGYRLPKPHRVTGLYDRGDIAGLARRHDVGLWLIPSIWPETFSFATREALATGLPVLTFDLGAQAEAARASGNGHVLGTDPSDSAALADAIERLLIRA